MSEHKPWCDRGVRPFGPCICDIPDPRHGERRAGERRHLPGPRGWERLTVCRRISDRRKNDEMAM